MRILRGQSNLEVSSKGFALFVVGLVLATFLGGALRTVLNSNQLHERIVAELKNRFPKHEFQIGQTQVLLSRGIWPGLGLKVNDLVFKQDVCGKLSFILTIPQATLPLDLLGLLHGRLRLNYVEIVGGGLHLDYRDCAPKLPLADPSTHRTSAAPVEPHRGMEMPKLRWPELAKFMDGIELKNFSVTYEKSPTWKLAFNSAYFSLGEELIAQALVDVEKSLPFGTLTHPVEFDLRADQNVMQWNFNGDFKEGHVHLNGSIDLNNQAGLLKATIRQIPIRDLMSEAYQMSLVDRDLKLKATWLSCTLKWEGHLQNFNEMPVGLRECRIEGGYGRAELDAADLWLGAPDYFKVPAHFKISQVQIQPVVEALNRQVLPAVLSKLGVWSGALDFSGENSWVLGGKLENAEMVFSNQSLLGKQGIESLRTTVKKSGAKIVARVDEVVFHEGEFAGFVEFDLSSNWRDGTFSSQIDKLTLSPAIQKLLVGGTIGALKGSGKGALSAGELSQWDGGFTLPAISGEGWAVQNLELRSKFQNNGIRLEGSAKTVAVDSSWRLYPQLRTVRPEAPEQIHWRGLAVTVDIQKNGGSVHAASATEDPSGFIWKGKGNWVRDGEFAGVLSAGAGKNAQSFALHGENGSLSVQDGSL